jgi:N-acyl-D-amino-acid deacylase
VRPGAIADLVVTDVAALAARSTYAEPTLLAEGIDDVLVAGRPVLRGGELTGQLAGRGIRRSAPSAT